MSGGAGYVLSREAVKKFANEAFGNSETCPDTYGAEDVQLGLCLQNVGVIAGDSRDEEGNERFLPLPVEYLIPEDKTWWYKNYSYYPQKEVRNENWNILLYNILLYIPISISRMPPAVHLVSYHFITLNPNNFMF